MFASRSRPFGDICSSEITHEVSFNCGAIPSPAIAHRITTALIDGWLSWTGTSERLLDDPEHLQEFRQWAPRLEHSGIDLGRKSQVRVEGAYVGGRFNTSASTTAWLEGDPAGPS